MWPHEVRKKILIINTYLQCIYGLVHFLIIEMVLHFVNVTTFEGMSPSWVWPQVVSRKMLIINTHILMYNVCIDLCIFLE